jgi:hypothetical protein
MNSRLIIKEITPSRHSSYCFVLYHINSNIQVLILPALQNNSLVYLIIQKFDKGQR